MKPGERIGRYTVLRRLASGGMAEVYLARHEGPKNFSKLVVIKRVLPGLLDTEKFIAMFLDEGRLAARLSHPNIAQTFELGEHDGGFHIVMEYVPGESLNRLVKRAVLEAKPVPPGVVLRIAMQVLEALDYAHELKGDRGEWLQVVHRDVSPTNVLITYHGQVKLLDFGIARSTAHEHHTQIGTVKGKGGYMSPEQAQAGTVDQRTDLYAVGSLLYLLTTGHGPFDGEGDVFAMMKAAIDGRFPRPSARNPNVPAELEAIILKATALKPDQRYATAGEMLGAIEEHAASQRLFPSSRELTNFIKQLFPERVELARSFDQAADAATAAKLAESLVEIESSEIVATPTRLARGRPVPKPSRLPLKHIETEKMPLQVGPLVRVNTKTVPLSTAKLPLPTNETAEALTAVPEMNQRRTQEALVQFRDASEEETKAVPDGRSSGRTLSVEQELPTAHGADTIDGSSRTLAPVRSRPQQQGFVVNSNAWAFVVAGLAAVLLGIAVMWALGAD